MFGKHHQDDATATSASASTTSTAACVPSDASASTAHVAGSLTSQDIMLIVSVAAGVLTFLICGVSILLHLAHRNNWAKQKYSIRIMLLPILWIVYTVLSIAFYGAQPFLDNIPKVHEAIAVTSMFGLFVVNVAPPRGRARDAFFAAQPRLNKEKEVMDDQGSLVWFKIQHIKVHQFPVVMLIIVIVSEILAATMCNSSKAYSRANTVLQALAGVSTFVSVMGLLALIGRFKTEQKACGAVSQLIVLKGLVAVVTLQQFIFNILGTQHSLSPTDTLSMADLLRGLPSTLTAVEMLIFSIAFACVFSDRRTAPRPGDAPGETVSLARALIDMIYLPDLVRELIYAFSSLGHMSSSDEVALRGGQQGQAQALWRDVSPERRVPHPPPGYTPAKGYDTSYNSYTNGYSGRT